MLLDPNAAMPNRQPPIRRLSRRKKLAFRVAGLALVWGTIELLAWGTLLLVEKNFSFEDLRRTQQSIALGSTTQREAQETIHPFQGWAFNPQVSRGVTLADRTVPVNDLGFVDDGPAVRKREPGQLIVGIAGGSVAWQMSVVGESALKITLAKELGRDPSGIQLVRMAMSGFKQPQQLMTLTWLMSLGSEFDIVINIDGYNEAVGAQDNRKAFVFMAYPHHWHARTQDIVDPREYSVAFELLQLRASRQQGALNVLQSWWRWSPTYQLIWVVRDYHERERRIALGQKLIEGHGTVGRRSFANVGPTQQFADQAESNRTAVAIWENSSTQMARLCAANGCHYLHVLQPNQYVPDSKSFSQKELKDYVSAETFQAEVIAQTYPQFISRGAERRAADGHFADLTRLFLQTEETIYSDVWCHYNERGNQMLAAAVAREAAAMLLQSNPDAK